MPSANPRPVRLLPDALPGVSASDAPAPVAPFRHRYMPALPRTLPTRELRPLRDICRERRASWRRRACGLLCD